MRLTALTLALAFCAPAHAQSAANEPGYAIVLGTTAVPAPSPSS